jgi:hypothetical protein
MEENSVARISALPARRSRTPLGMLATLLLAACAESGIAPGVVEDPGASEPNPPVYTLTGMVIEHTARGAAPRPHLAFRVIASRGTSSGLDTIAVASGADGRYQVSAPGRYFVLLPAGGTGYHAPCSGRIVVSSTDPDRVADFNVVADAVLSTTGMPASLRITDPNLNGRVTDSQTLRPVAGAFISYPGHLNGGTLTDAQGRFVLCSIPLPSGVIVRAEKAGFLSDSRRIDDPLISRVNIDLVLASY